MASVLPGKVKNKFKYHTIMLSLLSKLSAVGITIQPYYLELGRLRDINDQGVNFKPDLDLYEAKILDEEELKSIIEHPECKRISQNYTIKDRIADGCLCIGVKHHNIVVAYTWCDLIRCNHKPLPFQLEDNEVYLFDTYVFNNYRGKNIAPYLRYELYKHLDAMGRTDCYSITYAMNAPSLRFKEKINIKPVELYLYVSCFDKYHGNYRLKKM
jgi:hypothetical protein